MKSLYLKQLDVAKEKQNNSERLVYLTSVLRSLLQTSVVCSFEITKNLTPSDEIDLAELTNRFCKPSDGLPLEILNTLIPIIRAYAATDYLQGWFEPTRVINLPVS